MTTIQKVGFGIAILVVAGYLAYVYNRDGNFSSFGFTGSPTPMAIVTQTPSPSPAAAVVQKTPAPTTRPTATPASTSVLSTMNARRAQAGVGALTTNSTLQTIAQAHANDMATKGYFSHTNSSGVTFQQRITSSGYEGTSFAENIGYSSKTAVDIVAGWMESAEHRTNMLNDQYVGVGVGTAQGTYQGTPAVFVVAVFGNTK